MSRPTPPTDTNKNQDQTPANSSNDTPGLTFDWRDWLPYFEDQDIPETQKRELIETLWQIIVAFVDLGFDLNPHQQAEQKKLWTKSRSQNAAGSCRVKVGGCPRS